VFERFTERARQVVVLAQDEARLLKHNYIGTEHILLGLLREEEGLAARVLESLDITLEEVRGQVARVIGQGDEVPAGQVPFTPRAKKVLELSLREARSLQHNYIGTEHILLGVVRENEGVAARILFDLGADPAHVRGAVIAMLGGRSPSADQPLEDEIARLQAEKEAAIEARDFERAVRLREQQRELRRGTRPRGWTGYGSPIVEHRPFGFVIGWLLFVVALGIGLLLGWLIWG
jgi:hypothetical protein